MITYINISKTTTFYELDLEGYNIQMDLYYSKFSDRWLMDMFNRTTGATVKGVVLNVGLDMLTAAGRLGLQALVLVSLPKPGFEASYANFAESVVVAYMPLEEYDAYVLDQLLPEQIDPNSEFYVPEDQRTTSRTQWRRSS